MAAITTAVTASIKLAGDKKREGEFYQEEEFYKENLKIFVSSLPPSTDDRAVKLLLSIGEQAPSEVYKDFLNFCPPSLSKSLSYLLCKAKDAKAVSEKQLFLFIVCILESGRALDFLNDILKDILILSDFDESFELKLIKVIFKKLFKDNSEAEEISYTAVKSARTFLLMRFDEKLIQRAYREHSETEQEILLKLFFETKKDSWYKWLFSLIAINPRVFEKFYHALTETERNIIDRELGEQVNWIKKYFKNNNFSDAAIIFIYHPDSPWVLSEGDLTKISEKQVSEFLAALFTTGSGQIITKSFLALRAILENSTFVTTAETIPMLLTKYLAFSLGIKEINEATLLLSSRAAWNDAILKTLRNFTSEEGSLVIKGFLLAFKKMQNTDLMKKLKKEFPEVFAKKMGEMESDVAKEIGDALTRTVLIVKPTEYPCDTLYEEHLFNQWNIVSNNPEGLKKALDEIADTIYKTRDKFHKLSVHGFSLCLQRSIELKKIKETVQHLASQPLLAEHVLQAFALLSNEVQVILMSDGLEHGTSLYNPAFVCGLREINPGAFALALEAFSARNKALYERMQQFFLIPSAMRMIISDVMEPFTLPFRDMDDYAVKLFCAVTQKRKTYSFQPTVVVGSEFEAYLASLKTAKLPLREKFITCAENHWVCGEIEIPLTGSPRILILDSLGDREPKTREFLKRYCTNAFPHVDIYLSWHKRQISGLGCTLFALRDLQDLYTIEHYMEPQYHGDIFEYALQNRCEAYWSSDSEKMSCYSFRLPLRFMRNQQEPSDLESVISSRSPEERALVINKKKETVLESSKKHFCSFTDKHGKESIKNLRLVYKLNEMAKSIFNYFIENKFNIRQIESEMSRFSLEAFRTRIAKEDHTKVLLFFKRAKPGSVSSVTKESESENKLLAEIHPAGVDVIGESYINLYHIFQQKLMARIVNNISMLINTLMDKHKNHEIYDVKTLKEFFKQDLKPSSIRYIEAINDEVFKAMLQHIVALGAQLEKTRNFGRPS